MSPPDDRRDRGVVARAFGAALRSAREAVGLTQETLAQRAHLDRTYPSLLERGLRSPTLPCLFAISRALGLDPAALIAPAWRAYRTAGCAGAPPPDPAVSPRDPLESVAPTMTPNAPVPKVP